MSGQLCQACGEELPTELGCTVTTIEIRGHNYPVLPNAGPGQCEGCGTTPGGNHHGDCPHEKCPRCGELLAGCGCIARMGEAPPAPTSEVIAWTIDEEQVASLSDSEAAAAMDQVVFGLEEKITASLIGVGAHPPDVMTLRYNIARMMLVELVRKIAAAAAPPPSEPPGWDTSPPSE